MKMFNRLSERIRRNEPIPIPVAACLRGVSYGQRLGMWVRLHGRRETVPARVISFGNLTAGGTGKTPAVIDRARRECAAGERVAVLTRGYGAVRSRLPMVHDPSTGELVSPGRFGDEAALIAASAPGAWIVRCPDRVAGARAAMEHGCTVLILDDGYQAVGLERDENVLLVDATNPFGNGYVLPGVFARTGFSPETGHGNYDYPLRPGNGGAPAIDAVIRRYTPDTCALYRASACRFAPPVDGQEFPPDFSAVKLCMPLCGIGNPESFAHTLKNLGMTLGTMRVDRPRRHSHGAAPGGVPDYRNGEGRGAHGPCIPPRRLRVVRVANALQARGCGQGFNIILAGKVNILVGLRRMKVPRIAVHERTAPHARLFFGDFLCQRLKKLVRAGGRNRHDRFPAAQGAEEKFLQEAARWQAFPYHGTLGQHEREALFGTFDNRKTFRGQVVDIDSGKGLFIIAGSQQAYQGAFQRLRIFDGIRSGWGPCGPNCDGDAA